MKNAVTSRWILNILLLLLLIAVLFPVLFMVLTSFKSIEEIYAGASFFPRQPGFQNYVRVFTKTPFPIFIKNSLIVSVAVTVVGTVIASMAAYAVARYKHKLLVFNVFSKMLLLLQMFPLILMLIPLYMTFMRMRIVGSHLSLMMAYATFTLPFSIWLQSGFFEGTPLELEESAMIDGCSKWQTFVRIILPVSSPGVASAAIFTFINCWNEYMMATVFIRDERLRTLSPGLSTFIQQFGSEWDSLMAASSIAIIPVLFFLIFAQKYVVQGLTAGAVKG